MAGAPRRESTHTLPYIRCLRQTCTGGGASREAFHHACAVRAVSNETRTAPIQASASRFAHSYLFPASTRGHWKRGRKCKDLRRCVLCLTPFPPRESERALGTVHSYSATSVGHRHRPECIQCACWVDCGTS